MAMFVQTVPMKQNICLPQCQAFIAMCDVLDILQNIALQTIEPAQLVQAVETAFGSFCCSRLETVDDQEVPLATALW